MAAAPTVPPTHLVLGLGNPGAEYRYTRHNAGFFVIEELARRAGVRLRAGECNCLLAQHEATLPALPQTYMNRSGYAARCLMEKHGFAPERVLVVLDEVALPLGKLRMRPSGSPGGHRGLESVIEYLQSDQVPRLRLGIRPGDAAPAGDALVEFVLGAFTAEEREPLEAMVQRAADSCELWLSEGTQAAMARFNG